MAAFVFSTPGNNKHCMSSPARMTPEQRLTTIKKPPNFVVSLAKLSFAICSVTKTHTAPRPPRRARRHPYRRTVTRTTGPPVTHMLTTYLASSKCYNMLRSPPQNIHDPPPPTARQNNRCPTGVQPPYHRGNHRTCRCATLPLLRASAAATVNATGAHPPAACRHSTG